MKTTDVDNWPGDFNNLQGPDLMIRMEEHIKKFNVKIINDHINKVNLKKKFPLQISRGIHSESQNVFIEIIEDGITAWGESAPGKTEGATSAIEVEESLVNLIGEGKLAYSIKNQETAQFVEIKLDISPKAINKFIDFINLDQNLIRHYTLKI